MLSDNQLSGEIPSELGSLTDLWWLYLSDNRLSGEIPMELGSLSNLRELELSDNQLSGCIPEGLRDVASNDLEDLDLPFCASRSIREDAAEGSNVGNPVVATDDGEGDTLTYTLGGADADSFDIDSSTGQITVGDGTQLDYETKDRYDVTVTATDPSSGASDTTTVAIMVTDVRVSEDAAVNAYDANTNETIEKSEVIDAILDYLNYEIEKGLVLDLIGLYFGPTPTPVPTATPTPTPEPNDTAVNGVSHPCGPSHSIIGPWEKPEHFIDWTPDGSRLIFDDGTAVMVVDADGSRLRAIVDANPRFSLPWGFHADVSPDGSRIAYSSCQYSTEGLTLRGRPHSGRMKYHYEIASVAIDGSERKRLTENGYMDHYPTWSPDGSRIAFIRGSHYWHSDGPLRTMLEDGSNEEDIWRDRTAYTPTRSRMDAFHVAPAWSPDGEQLAFVVFFYVYEEGRSPSLQRDVYTVRADGSGLRRVSETVSAASWSPDGHRLALAKLDGEDVVLFTVAPDGSDPQAITTITDREAFENFYGRYDSWIGTLAWSPNETQTHIMFVCDVGLCVVNLDGVVIGESTIEEVPWHFRTGELYGRPQAAWSPDGSKIAVRVPNDPRPDPGGNPVVYTMDPDGTNVDVLVRSGLAKLSEVHGDRGDTFDIASCRDGFVVPEPERHPGLVGDCEALKIVKDVLAHNIALNWGSSAPIDQWEGITIGGSPPRVTGLELLWGMGIGEETSVVFSHELLPGSTLPIELAELTKLQTLSLTVNFLHGTVPPELGSLMDLRYLYLKWNKLSGCLPMQISDLWVDTTGLERYEAQSP